MDKNAQQPLTLAPEALLSYGEAAEIMHVSVKYITDLAKSGNMIVLYWGPSRQPRIPRWALRKWQEEEIKNDQNRKPNLEIRRGEKRREP